MGDREFLERLADECASQSLTRIFLEGVRPQVIAKLEEEFHATSGLKIQLALKVMMSKPLQDFVEYYRFMFRHREVGLVGPWLEEPIEH